MTPQTVKEGTKLSESEIKDVVSKVNYYGAKELLEHTYVTDGYFSAMGYRLQGYIKIEEVNSNFFYIPTSQVALVNGQRVIYFTTIMEFKD